MSLYPLVSIIIPVYNGSNYLREAIDSAVNQTYRHVEVIVINDGSEDGGETERIARSYGDKIKYFHKKNGGVATALNLGIKESLGDYISWLSHDDLYYPFKIEKQVEYLDKLLNRKVLLFSDYDVINYMSNSKYTSRHGDHCSQNIKSMLRMLFSSSLHGCSMLIPRECFDRVGCFSEDLRTTQDYDLWFRFLKSGYEFHHIPESLILTRHHKEQGTHTLIDLHIRELYQLYSSAIDQFSSDLKSFDIVEIDDFIKIMDGRGLVDIRNILLDLRDSIENLAKIRSGIPVIWLYWENKGDKKTPIIINYCHETIKRSNHQDFVVVCTNPKNIKFYLDELNEDYLLFEKIAHKADYLRFNLLYRYGGIWLDSDFISFKSLKPILEKIEEIGFVYTGYIMDDGSVFPIIHFLGSKKNNPILKELISNVDTIINTKVKNGIQPSWDEIGGYSLQPLLNEENSHRYGTRVFSRVDVHGYGQREMFFPLKFSNNDDSIYGQMLCYSVHSDFFEIMGEDILKMKCYLSDELNKHLSPVTKCKSFRVVRVLRGKSLEAITRRVFFYFKDYFKNLLQKTS